MLSIPNPQPETHSTETKRQPGLTKTFCSATPKETCGGEETFPPAQYEKTYQPTVFSGVNVDILFWSTFPLYAQINTKICYVCPDVQKERQNNKIAE